MMWCICAKCMLRERTATGRIRCIRDAPGAFRIKLRATPREKWKREREKDSYQLHHLGNRVILSVIARVHRKIKIWIARRRRKERKSERERTREGKRERKEERGSFVVVTTPRAFVLFLHFYVLFYALRTTRDFDGRIPRIRPPRFCLSVPLNHLNSFPHYTWLQEKKSSGEVRLRGYTGVRRDDNR